MMDNNQLQSNNENQMNVRIVTLPPIRMISAYGFGKEPEQIAWQKIIHFISEQKLSLNGENLKTFGFNNPGPSAGSPNYGYEIWLPISEDIEPTGDLKIIDYNGGLYAVTTFKDLSNIGKIWGKLSKWREASKYRIGVHQWFEELLTPPDTAIEDYIFNLYLPILE